MSLHAKTCSVTTVVRALAERDLLPDEEVLRYVLDELDVVPADQCEPARSWSTGRCGSPRSIFWTSS